MKNVRYRISPELAKFAAKPGQQEKDGDVLMGVGVKEPIDHFRRGISWVS